jgi:hypothetical protein
MKAGFSIQAVADLAGRLVDTGLSCPAAGTTARPWIASRLVV